MPSHYDTATSGDDFMTDRPIVNRLFRQHINADEGWLGPEYSRLQNPEVDMLLKQGAATLEQSQRRPIYQKIQAIIRHDLPLLPIFQNVNIRSNCWNIKDWYWV